MNGSKDLKTIIYFKGVYDTLDLFTDHLIGAFEAMGYDADTLVRNFS